MVLVHDNSVLAGVAPTLHHQAGIIVGGVAAPAAAAFKIIERERISIYLEVR